MARTTIFLVGKGATPTYLPPGAVDGNEHGVATAAEWIRGAGGQHKLHVGDLKIAPKLSCELTNSGLPLLAGAFRASYPDGFPDSDWCIKAGTPETSYTVTSAMIDSLKCSWSYGQRVKLDVTFAALMAAHATGLAAVDIPADDAFFSTPDMAVQVSVAGAAATGLKCKGWSWGIDNKAKATGDGDTARAALAKHFPTYFDIGEEVPSIELDVEVPTAFSAVLDDPSVNAIDFTLGCNNGAGTDYSGFVLTGTGIFIPDPDKHSIRAADDGYVLYKLVGMPKPGDIAIALNTPGGT